MSGWFHVPQRVLEPRLRLFCFPFAGGNAATFHGWPKRLPQDVEVRAVALPGRGFRLREPLFTQMAPLLATLLGEVTPFLDRPCAFFGHSMGAVIAFELAHALWEAGQQLPATLFISGRRAPTIQGADRSLHRLEGTDFAQALRSHYAVPQAVLDDPDLQALVFPPLRADLELLETFVHPPHPPLPIQLVGFAGASDPSASADAVSGWAKETTSRFRLHELPGDHFFIKAAEPELLRRISEYV